MTQKEIGINWHYKLKGGGNRYYIYGVFKTIYFLFIGINSHQNIGFRSSQHNIMAE